LIWQRIKSGDLDALGTLYDQYVDALYQYGNKLCADSDYVNDCIHDVFLDIYKYRKNLSSTDNVEYYLLRSLKNKILKKHKSRIIALSFNDNIDFNTAEWATSSIEENIIEREWCDERSMRLTAAMGLLTKQQKKGINLRFVEDKNYPEIADRLNVSIETARTVIYRGIKLLRQNMLMIFLMSLT
jgi:RNA polymerase sigma-70 factor (ECF subfamily)